jgi:Flp pilus assembly protein TadD
MDDVYELFSRGSALLADGHHHQAVVPLRRASLLSPESTSIREALGRALFQAQHYSEAADEFRAVVDLAPTNDYALFCLGRSLQMLGRHAEARKPLALAATMKPERSDYRTYRDHSRDVTERATAEQDDAA